MAYILGFFCADGSLTINPRGSHYMDFHMTDKTLLQDIRRVMSSNHKLVERRRSHKWSPLYRLQIGSKEMCNDLQNLGVHERKTYTMTVPHVPKEYFSDFVRGYFDGDGNVWMGEIHKKRKTQLLTIQTGFTSCSNGFLTSLRDELSKMGIHGSVYKRKGENAFRLQFSIKGSIMLYQLMYKDLSSDLFLNRKKKVFEKYINMRR